MGLSFLLPPARTAICVFEGSLPGSCSLFFYSAAYVQEVKLQTDNQLLSVALRCVPGNELLSNGRTFQTGANKACLRPSAVQSFC